MTAARPRFLGGVFVAKLIGLVTNRFLADRASPEIPPSPPPHPAPVAVLPIASSTQLAPERARITADPPFALEQDSALLHALIEARQFTLALEFAREMPAELVTGLTIDVFRQWALQQPQTAVEAAQSLADGSQQRAAFVEVMRTWASGDAPAAANYLLTQAPREDRDKAFRQTISLWAAHDPVALAQWLDGVPPGADFDVGAAALVALAENKYRQPDTALPWIDLISDPTRKRDALQRVLLGWRDSNPAAAQSYLAGVPWLSSEDRAALSRQRASAP